MEYSKLAMGQVVGVTSGIIPVVLPFIPNVVELNNFTASTTPANTGVVRTYWTSDMAQASAIQYVFNATPVLTTQTTTTGGISTFSAGTPQLQAAKTGTGISQATPAVVTITGHGYSTGDVVLLTKTTGMLQVAGQYYVITRTGANTFTIDIDSSGFAAAATNVVGQKVVAPYLYFPGDNVITAISTGATTTVTTATNHNYVVGQQIGFSIPSAWGTTSALSRGLGLYTPQYFFVSSVGSATQFTFAFNSTGLTFAYPTSATAAAGLTFPQVVAIGDNNTGALPAGVSFPPPTTINGPTIAGAFQANTRQGFIIGNTSSGTTSDVILWTAYAMDLVSS